MAGAPTPPRARPPPPPPPRARWAARGGTRGRGSPPPPPSAAAPAQEATPDTACHLLVQVTPSAYGGDAYRVKAWLLGPARPECLLAGEEEHGRAALPALLDDLRLELVGRQSSIDG